MRLGVGVGLGLGGLAPAFVPTDVSGAIIWLRADLGYAAGTWTDQSGNGNSFAQATGGKRPTVAAGEIGGKDALRFTAASQQTLRKTSFSGPASGEVFVVGKLVADPAAGIASAGMLRFGTGGSVDYYPFTDGVIYCGFGSTARKNTANPAAAMTSPFVYNVRTAANAWSNYINGTQLHTTGTNTVGFESALEIGSWADLNTWMDGWIAELILYNSVLSAGNRSLVHAYLTARYGITIA